MGIQKKTNMEVENQRWPKHFVEFTERTPSQLFFRIFSSFQVSYDISSVERM